MKLYNFYLIGLNKSKHHLLFSINLFLENVFINNYLLSNSLFFSKIITKKKSPVLSYNQISGKNFFEKKKLLIALKNDYLFFFLSNKIKYFFYIFYSNFLSSFFFKKKQIILNFSIFYKKTFNEGFYFIRGLFLFFLIDSLITDDEPLWEPIEWSLVQTWLFFIFAFAWIAENLITSRYGSYTGRDKRVWFAWYKTFWLIEMWYIISLGATCMFVIVPFYYELTYTVSFVFSWWNWYNRVFFFKFISSYTIIILIAHFFQINIKWLNWKKNLFFITLIIFFLSYLLYTQFIITFFSYFTDPLWYQKTRFIDYIQLSHEPLKWGWGPAKRDHFTYHKVSTVFWFKNDTPFAAAFLFINLFFFFFLFFLLMYWLVLLRKTYATKEISFTLATYCVSALKQFYYFFFFFYVLVFISFIVCYWRFPIEFFWLLNANSWLVNFFKILLSYPSFFLNLFF